MPKCLTGVYAVLLSTVLVAVLDFCTTAPVLGSILFILPLALCALQRSTLVLWATAVAVSVLTMIAGQWDFGRNGSTEIQIALVNRGLLVASLLTLAAFIHLRMASSRKGEPVVDGIQQPRGAVVVHTERSAKPAGLPSVEHTAPVQGKEQFAQLNTRYRGLLDACSEAMVVIDQHDRIILLNSAVERLFGYKREELIEKPIGILIPQRFRQQPFGPGSTADGALALGAHDAPVAVHLYDLVVAHALHSLGATLDLQAQRKNGSVFLAEMLFTPLDAADGKLVSATIRDATDRNKPLEAQQQLLAILQASDDAIIVEDLEGIITLWNRGAEVIFGYGPEEIIGKPTSTLFPAEHLQQELAIEQSALLGDRVRHHDTVRVRKDGSLVDVSLTIAPIRNEKGEITGASKFAHDISERKKQDKENRRLELRFQRLLESAPDAMVIVDSGGNIQLANAQAELIFGYTKPEMLGHPVMLLIPSNLLGTGEHQEANLTRDPKSRMMGHGIELEGKRKDGSGFPIEIALSPLDMQDGLLVSVAVRDITDRRRAENEIRELNRTLEQRVQDRTTQLLKSEQRFHNALDMMIEGVQIIGFDWTHLYVNDALVAQSTFTREDLIGHTMMARYPGIEQTAMFNVFTRCMEVREAHNMETEFTFPNGTSNFFHLSIQPVDEGLVILSTDITERNRAKSELAAQREQLERQNKDLEQFAFVASHDLKEPLRMVTSYVQLLERRYSDKLDADALEFIAFAVDGAARMKQLINDLLVYSQLGRAVKTEDVDMNTTLRLVQANLAALVEEAGATITSTELPIVRSSPTEMLQVLQNLVANAVKFRRDDAAPVIHLTARAERDHWHLEVQDNGIGIEEQYHDMVFAPFKRLHDKSKYSGSGIGLAVAEKIVRANGGRIWFTSTPGVGTTFHFTIKRI